MGAAAGSHTKKELLLVKRLQNRAKRVFNRGRTTWRASLTRPQSHRDHRNKTIFVPRKRGHGPEPSAGRSRAPPPAFRGHGSISQRPHPSGSKPQVPCPSCPGPGTSAALGKKSRSRMVQPRGSQAAGHPVPSSHLPPARTLQRPCCRNASVSAPMPHAEPIRLPHGTGICCSGTAKGHGQREGCQPRARCSVGLGDGETRLEPGTFSSPSNPPRFGAIALAISSRRKKVVWVVGEPSGHEATSQQGCKDTCTSPTPQEGSGKGGEPDPALPPQ